jgi:hypothetical protein
MLCREFFIDPGCCIPAPRALLRVFKHYGIEAKPLAVKVTIHNSKLRAALEENTLPPEITTALKTGMFHLHSTMAPSECVTWLRARAMQPVVLGSAQTARGSYATHAAHLVAFLPKHSILIDPTIAQANRPERQIEMPVIVAQINDPRFFAGEVTWRCEVNGCSVEYRGFPQERGYLKSTSWTDSKRTWPLARALTTIIDGSNVQRH